MSERTCIIPGCDRDYRARGYCATHYNQALAPDRHRTTIVCAECGTEYTTTRTTGSYCSLACRDAAGPDAHRHIREERQFVRERKRARLEASRSRKEEREALRGALEAGDRAGILEGLRAGSVIDSQGCWNWRNNTGRRYPVLVVQGRTFLVHRLALATQVGAPLGDQPVHHICANPRCCNPEHLQLVTHRENIAEMLTRTYMTRRIRALERALATYDPTHPLLSEVGLPGTDP
jgi:hypothetical protein